MKREEIDFENFKDNFLFVFIFKPIERPNFDNFLKTHFNIYKKLYKKTYTVQEYAKNEMGYYELKKYGMELKPNFS